MWFIIVRYSSILGGSWVAISRVISRITMLTTHFRGLITLLITAHEPGLSQRTQYPLIKEYSLNENMKASMI